MHKHFEGKSALQHVHDKRTSGGVLSEPHGQELSGFFFGLVDGCRLTAGFVLISSFLLDWKMTLLIAAGLLLLLAGRAALLGHERLQRLHRLADQERYEIEHHRAQEREELQALYASKGFKGEPLEKVVDVLMADDNRLLTVMLEEEMGLQLEVYEHPLKHALAVLLGGAFSLSLCLPLFIFPTPTAQIAALLLITVVSAIAAKKEQSPIVSSSIWHMAIALLAGILVYLL